jgi:SNF2 family DNA or RNA helicase
LIWARFIEELKIIATALTEIYGQDSVACYWGEFSNKQKDDAKRKFIQTEKCRFFVAQPKSGGTGLDGLQIAQAEIYFSNEWSLIDRIQSEDRGHRSGMTNDHLTIYDIEAVDSLDHRVIDALIEKKEIADMITGDPPQNWI